MKKIIINGCFGGYSWSEQALDEISRRSGKKVTRWMQDLREDPVAIEVLEEYGSEWCSGSSAALEIEEYDETLYRPFISDYDGVESLNNVLSIPRDRIDSLSKDELVALLDKVGVIRKEETDAEEDFVPIPEDELPWMLVSPD